MRRWLRNILVLLACGLIAAASQPPPAGRVATGQVVTQAISRSDWSSLAPAVAAQSQWYTTLAARTVTTSRPSVARSGGSHRGYAAAKECVSMIEHGGSYDASTNPTHKGRYQFSRPAWISFGGVPEHWDNWDLATPAEQDEVFETAWSQGPAVQEQQWLRWDGC